MAFCKEYASADCPRYREFPGCVATCHRWETGEPVLPVTEPSTERVDFTRARMSMNLPDVAIIARHKTADPNVEIVLAVIYGPEYVTWQHVISREDYPGDPTATFSGHYTRDLADAIADFNTRH